MHPKITERIARRLHALIAVLVLLLPACGQADRTETTGTPPDDPIQVAQAEPTQAKPGAEPSPSRSGAGKPNIVLVFMDNFGWGEPGFNGGGIVRGAATPRLDRLASEGLRLTNFNVEVQCTPSRSAIMTGRYAIRSGNGTVPLGEGVYGLVQWEVTMAEMLSNAGYATGMYGKWHLGRTKGRFPTDQGFDEWYGIPNTTDESAYTSLQGFAESGIPKPYVLDSVKGSDPKQARVYDVEYRPLIDRDLTDRAIKFMKKQSQAKKPFFIYLPYTATHFPTMPHPDFKGKSGKGAWGDLLMQIDSYVGELLDTIDDLGIADDTIFIFTADNGPESLGSGETSLTVETAVHGTAGPWRSSLFTGYEGALRVPFAIRWPGKIKAGGRARSKRGARATRSFMKWICSRRSPRLPEERSLKIALLTERTYPISSWERVRNRDATAL
jgi:arylsulfatase